MGLSADNVPVNPTKLSTVILCAESKKGLDFASSWSNRDTLALLAFSCAARNRATRCSGVSPCGIDPPAGDAGLPGPPAPAAGGNRDLEDACGVVAVNRVAEVALRSPSLLAILSVGSIA